MLTGVGWCQDETSGWVERLTIWATPELQALNGEKEGLTRELGTLPVPAATNSGVRRGFQTGRVKEGDDPWVALKLLKPCEAEWVVLVPVLGKGARGEVSGYGFPSRFQLEAEDDEGMTHLLMDETASDFPNPGNYPLRVACPPGVKIAKVRLTATEPWKQGGPEALALAELLVLSGDRNVAIGGKVTASSSREMRPTWSSSNLTDMTMPLGMPVAPDEGVTLGWRSGPQDSREDKRLVVVDLGGEFKVDEIQLAPVLKPGVSGSLNFGFPSRYAVVTALEQDFEEQHLVMDGTEKNQEIPGQNLQCVLVKPVPIRYISVVATRLRDSAGEFLFALGELRAYEGGKNVALGAQVISRDSVEDAGWSGKALTDGLAGGGRLLPLSDWFEGLERRLVAESRLAAIEARRVLLLEQGERVLIHGSIGTTVCLLVGAVFFGLRGRRQRRVSRERQRERLARDLHDELGSNLGSIALISSFALEGGTDEGQMRGDMREIETVARESADSMRDLVELLGGRHRGAENNWLPVLQGMAERVVRGVDLESDLGEGSWVMQPDLEARREIYLFCKEALHNVVRHANATQVRFVIGPTVAGLRVTVEDNGEGFDVTKDSEGFGLSNLRERASDLRAEMDLASTPGKGTVVTLNVPQRRRWRKYKGKKQS